MDDFKDSCAGCAFLLLLLFAGLGILGHFGQKRKEMEHQIQSLKEKKQKYQEELEDTKRRLHQAKDTLRKTDDELQACAKQGESCESELSTYKTYGEASLGHLFGNFAKNAEEILAVFDLDVKWTLGYEPITARTNSNGRNENKNTAMGSRPGLLLGARSKHIFFIASVREGIAPLRLTDKDLPDPPNPIREGFFSIPYELSKVDATVNISFKDSSDKKYKSIILNCWRGPRFTVFLAGARTEDDLSINVPAYLEYESWSNFSEKRFSFLEMSHNGGLSVRQDNHSWKYDNLLPRSRLGLPGHIGFSFLPLTSSNEPAVHSFFIQMTEDQAYWIPFWRLLRALGVMDRPVAPEDCFSLIFRQEGKDKNILVNHAGAFEPQDVMRNIGSALIEDARIKASKLNLN